MLVIRLLMADPAASSRALLMRKPDDNRWMAWLSADSLRRALSSPRSDKVLVRMDVTSFILLIELQHL